MSVILDYTSLRSYLVNGALVDSSYTTSMSSTSSVSEFDSYTLEPQSYKQAYQITEWCETMNHEF